MPPASPSLSFPRPALPPGTAELRREVRAFLAEEIGSGRITPTCDSWLGGFDAGFSRRLGERGWLGLTLPRGYGGHERSALDRFVVTEELLAAGAPVGAHWVADRQTGLSLLRYGSEEQRQRFLPAIARGECFFAIGMSEPDSGSDLASVRTRAERVEGGWRVTGSKVWTSGAHHAHAFFVLCRTSPLDEAHRHAGLSQLIVMLDAPGVQIRPIRLLTGEHDFNEVVLDGVFVPDDMVLGTVGDGWRQCTSELAFERSGPERFLSTFPLLAALVGRLEKDPGAADTTTVGLLVAELWALRQMSLSVATALAAGGAPEVEAALLKDVGTRYEKAVIDAARLVSSAEPDPEAVEDFPRLLARAVLHAPGFTLRGGTNEILRGVVARALGVR